jgi:hypothetical protein
MSSQNPSVPETSSNIILFRPRQSLSFSPRHSSRLLFEAGGQVVDRAAFFAAFADRWTSFHRSEFAGPVDVAFHYGTTVRGAEKWLDGLGGARAEKLAWTLVTVPGAADRLLRAPERRAA